MAKNLKPFKIDNIDYVWNYTKARNIIDSYVKEKGVTKVSVYEDIAGICIISSEAVKNWFGRKNGPGEIEYITKMADYFGVDCKELLTKLRSTEEKIMDEFFESMLESMQFENNGINNKTVRFIGLLNELAKDTEKGFMGFNKFVSHHKYHGTTIEELSVPEYTGEFYPGIIYVDEEGPDYGKIVCDMCVDFQHGDIVSTYDEYVRDCIGGEMKIIVNDEEEDSPFIDISSDDGLYIAIHDGKWYCCG